MRFVGLTGGIGSGKSSVSGRLARFGVEILDADQIVRDLQEPGQPVFVAMVERWGQRIVQGPDGDAPGSLDRAVVASIVFSDRNELKAVEALVHPAVRTEIAGRIASAQGTDRTLIFDNPLLVKKAREDTDGDGSNERADPEDAAADRWPATSALIVVDCPLETAIDRLMSFRGFERADAEKRIAAQASRSERVAKADFVIDNGGELEQLDHQVDACWEWLQTLPQA